MPTSTVFPSLTWLLPKFWHGWSVIHGTTRPVRLDVTPELSASFDIEPHQWHHVMHLRVHHGLLAGIVRRLTSLLPAAAQRVIQSWAPGPFLPTELIIKKAKVDWEDEFDNEVRMYDRLAPVQGAVIPTFHGVVSVNGSTRAMLLSDVGGRQLLVVPYSEVSRDGLRRMLVAALRPIFERGISPNDANLLNCHVIDGQRIIILDHEQDEDLDDDLMDRIDEVVEGMADSIMRRHWHVHKPQEPGDVL